MSQESFKPETSQEEIRGKLEQTLASLQNEIKEMVGEYKELLENQSFNIDGGEKKKEAIQARINYVLKKAEKIKAKIDLGHNSILGQEEINEIRQEDFRKISDKFLIGMKYFGIANEYAHKYDYELISVGYAKETDFKNRPVIVINLAINPDAKITPSDNATVGIIENPKIYVFSDHEVRYPDYDAKDYAIAADPTKEDFIQMLTDEEYKSLEEMINNIDKK